jgi:hypothetical protein
MAPGLPHKEFVIATKVAAPFAKKSVDGLWQGISIDLWRHIAEQLHLRYGFIELATVQELLDATPKATLTLQSPQSPSQRLGREAVILPSHSMTQGWE